MLDRYRKSKCVVCQRTPCDPAHIKSRGSGGTNEDWNLIALCRLCHIRQHKIGVLEFARKNQIYWLEIQLKGWYINELGKLWNNNLNKTK